MNTSNSSKIDFNSSDINKIRNIFFYSVMENNNTPINTMYTFKNISIFPIFCLFYLYILFYIYSIQYDFFYKLLDL